MPANEWPLSAPHPVGAWCTGSQCSWDCGTATWHCAEPWFLQPLSTILTWGSPSAPQAQHHHCPFFSAASVLNCLSGQSQDVYSIFSQQMKFPNRHHFISAVFTSVSLVCKTKYWWLQPGRQSLYYFCRVQIISKISDAYMPFYLFRTAFTSLLQCLSWKRRVKHHVCSYVHSVNGCW